MNRPIVELIAAGLFAALFSTLMVQGVGYSGRSSYMPVAATGIGLAMCLMWAVQSARLLAAGEPKHYDTRREDILRFALIIGAGILYVAGFIWLGFFTSTIVLVPAVSLALGYRNLPVIALTTLGFTLVLYAVFRLLLSVPMPPEALLTLFGA